MLINSVIWRVAVKDEKTDMTKKLVRQILKWNDVRIWLTWVLSRKTEKQSRDGDPDRRLGRQALLKRPKLDLSHLTVARRKKRWTGLLENKKLKISWPMIFLFAK
jgi:hypothetical protein